MSVNLDRLEGLAADLADTGEHDREADAVHGAYEALLHLRAALERIVEATTVSYDASKGGGR